MPEDSAKDWVFDQLFLESGKIFLKTYFNYAVGRRQNRLAEAGENDYPEYG